MCPVELNIGGGWEKGKPEGEKGGGRRGADQAETIIIAAEVLSYF